MVQKVRSITAYPLGIFSAIIVTAMLFMALPLHWIDDKKIDSDNEMAPISTLKQYAFNLNTLFELDSGLHM